MEIMDGLLAGVLPAILIGIIGYFIDKHFKDIKTFQEETLQARAETAIKLDSIIEKVGAVSTEVKVIEANLISHVKADESVQKGIESNIQQIKHKLEII